VISTSALEHDLTIWSKLYIAGRLHKPVLDLMGPGTKQLAECLKLNREMAIMAALLQEERFVRKFDLFHGIAELSYLGKSFVVEEG
jgi:translocator assembly and maintenance protein 41